MFLKHGPFRASLIRRTRLGTNRPMAFPRRAGAFKSLEPNKSDAVLESALRQSTKLRACVDIANCTALKF